MGAAEEGGVELSHRGMGHRSLVLVRTAALLEVPFQDTHVIRQVAMGRHRRARAPIPALRAAPSQGPRVTRRVAMGRRQHVPIHVHWGVDS